MPRRLLSIIGPGILVAATGVGAGDLLTASLGDSALGTAILWAVAVGVVFKWFLNEGIARWQLATGTTLLEGWVDRLGGWIKWVFLTYLLSWTFLTGEALVTACGVAGTALFGLSMVIIGSQVRIEGSGVRVAPLLAEQLGAVLGSAGRFTFLLGFWGAVFASLLGVWQSIPYLFSDFVQLQRHRIRSENRARNLSKTRSYRAYLFAIAVVSLPVLWISVKRA